MPLLWLNAMLRYIKCDRASPQKLSIFNDNWIIYSVWSAIFLTTLKNNIYKGCVCLWLILIPKVGCSFVEIALPTEPLPSYSEYGWEVQRTNFIYKRMISSCNHNQHWLTSTCSIAMAPKQQGERKDGEKITPSEGLSK